MRSRTLIALFLAAFLTSTSATPTTTAAGKKLTGDGVKERVEFVSTSRPTWLANNNKGESR